MPYLRSAGGGKTKNNDCCLGFNMEKKKLDLPKNPKAFRLGEYLILLLIIFNPFAFN